MVARLRRLGLVFSLISVFAVPTYADPIVVTGGSTFLWWDSSGGGVTLQGSGLAVSADSSGTGAFLLASGFGNYLDGTLTFATIGGGPHPFIVTVNGTTYDAFLSGSLNFDADPVLVPPVAGRTAPGVTVTSPFAMNGRLLGTTGAFGTGSVLFDVSLTGLGTASVAAFPVDTNLFRANGTLYEFAPAAVAATPEPATLLLMGTGLGALLMRRRRQAHVARGSL